MKRLVLIATGFPSVALAHGAHAPVPEAMHGTAHAGPAAAMVNVDSTARPTASPLRGRERFATKVMVFPFLLVLLDLGKTLFLSLLCGFQP